MSRCPKCQQDTLQTLSYEYTQHDLDYSGFCQGYRSSCSHCGYYYQNENERISEGVSTPPEDIHEWARIAAAYLRAFKVY